MSDYFKTRKRNTLAKLRQIREDLPDFCDQFFIGIEPQTTELTRLNYAYDLRLFFYYLSTATKAFRDRAPVSFTLGDMERVTMTQLEGYIEWLTSYMYNGKQCSNEERGKARKLSTVRTLFKYLFNKGLLPSNVASKIPLPKLHDKEIIRLEVDEVANMLDTVDSGEGLTKHSQDFHEKTKQRDNAIVTLLLGTGIRVSECVGLNVSDIDFNSNAFTVTRKGGSKTILYFGNEVSFALSDYIDGERKKIKDKQDEDALFLSLQKKRICVRAVENLVKKYAKIITPLKQISPHKLRSTFGTNLYQATSDIYMVADVLGHRDVNTTKRHYAAISDEHRRKAASVIVLRDDKND
ncbi:MAG TPA: tyrosine-type recombinase/integrase [Clostridia bacterium]|nr:tyrosine-type recombinase/integrase [Clostridia bacterium]